jgi:hypothetical protein
VSTVDDKRLSSQSGFRECALCRADDVTDGCRVPCQTAPSANFRVVGQARIRTTARSAQACSVKQVGFRGEYLQTITQRGTLQFAVCELSVPLQDDLHGLDAEYYDKPSPVLSRRAEEMQVWRMLTRRHYNAAVKLPVAAATPCSLVAGFSRLEGTYSGSNLENASSVFIRTARCHGTDDNVNRDVCRPLVHPTPPSVLTLGSRLPIQTERGAGVPDYFSLVSTTQELLARDTRLRSTEPRVWPWGIRRAHHATLLYPQKWALTSPTSGGRSVGV